MTLQTDPLYLVYVLTFSLAALASLASAARARKIDNPDTRRGLFWLLVTSGGWAAAHVGYLVAPTAGQKEVFYVAGLIVGFAAVGPWLYFCSAYTGRSLHRNAAVRRLAVTLYLAVVAVKLTNPLHGLYYSTAFLQTPFPHLAVHHGLFHWMAMGLAYALAIVGYFMLFELFTQVGADARPLAALALVTGLPVVLDVVGLATPALIDITYEPLGVATFSVLTLFIFLDRFQSVRLAGSSDAPVVVLSAEDRIRDYNRSATELFPALTDDDAIGQRVEELLPSLADALASESAILDVGRNGATRYYHVSESPFGTGRTDLGRVISVDDVTHQERYRRELERQNDRLEQFASMVSHDLRNPLNVAMGRIGEARREADDDNLEKAGAALERMQELIDDLLALARTGQPIDETEPVSLTSVAQESWGLVDTADAELEVGDDLVFQADPDRLQQLFENCFRNAVEHGGEDVTVGVGAIDDGFYVEDDGPGIPEDERKDVLESGYTTAEGGTGFGLAIVSEVVEAHGWAIAVTESASGGARFEVTGVRVVEE